MWHADLQFLIAASKGSPEDDIAGCFQCSAVSKSHCGSTYGVPTVRWTEAQKKPLSSVSPRNSRFGIRRKWNEFGK